MKCEFCGIEDDTVTIVDNPHNDCQKIALCDKCYENACDNETYY